MTDPTIDKAALEACPWCGLTEHLSVRAEGSYTPDMPARPYRVVCNHIDHDTVEGPIGYGRNGATTAWNRRAIPSTTDAVGVTDERHYEIRRPVAWVILLNYGEGRWSGEMLTDVLPKDSTQYKIVRPLYASPTTSPHAPEGVRDDVLEEAAKLCDDEADKRFAQARKADAGDTSWGVDLAASASAQDNKAITARALGAAIRALKGNRT